MSECFICFEATWVEVGTHTIGATCPVDRLPSALGVNLVGVARSHWGEKRFWFCRNKAWATRSSLVATQACCAQRERPSFCPCRNALVLCCAGLILRFTSARRQTRLLNLTCTVLSSACRWRLA